MLYTLRYRTVLSNGASLFILLLELTVLHCSWSPRELNKCVNHICPIGKVSKYTTSWFMNRRQIQGCQWDILKKTYRFTKKKTDLNRKSQLDTKLDQSFYYLPYLDICKSQNVLLNIHCNFADKLLCLSGLLYRSNMDLFGFLTVIWRNLQQLNIYSQSPFVANLWYLDLFTIPP